MSFFKVTIIGGYTYFKEVLLEIDLGEYCDTLMFLVNKRDLFGDNMVVWQNTALGPCVRINIVHMVLLLFVSTNEQDPLDVLVGLRTDTWSKKITLGSLGKLDKFLGTVWSNFYNDTSSDEDGFLEWEYHELRGVKLDDIVRKQFLVFLEVDCLVLLVHGLQVEEELWLLVDGVLAIVSPWVFFKIHLMEFLTNVHG